MSRTFVIAVLALAAGATSFTGGATAGKAVASPEPLPPAARGLAFAGQHCAACHAVAENHTSPNPEAPSFEDIANRPGVTSTTLQQFLRDSHNYPEAMNFHVDQTQIADLADYIATLRKAGYRPVM